MFKFVLIAALVACAYAGEHVISVAYPNGGGTYGIAVPSGSAGHVSPVVSPVKVSGSSSHVSSDDVHAEIKTLESDVRPDGFTYYLETTNNIEGKASGDEHGGITGEFSWISPEGEHIKVTYTADEHGYQPSGAVLPVAPPTPEYVLKTIAYNAAHPYVEKSGH